MSNVVDLKTHRRDDATAAVAPDDRAASAELGALQQLQALCAKAVAAGGLDAGGPSALDFTVAVHRALKGTEWRVRFQRGRVSSA
jgi:predicted dinucleotide-binding enzyme